MNQEKYIGMDVHGATISVAVINAQGTFSAVNFGALPSRSSGRDVHVR